MNVFSCLIFQPDTDDRPKSRRSQDKEKNIPRKILQKTNSEEKPEAAGSSSNPRSASTSKSILSFDRLIPRSGEAANRKRSGK
jgi:hypothetical protein